MSSIQRKNATNVLCVLFFFVEKFAQKKYLLYSAHVSCMPVQCLRATATIDIDALNQFEHNSQSLQKDFVNMDTNNLDSNTKSSDPIVAVASAAVLTYDALTHLAIKTFKDLSEDMYKIKTIELIKMC